jgi:pimeloyl-ACP methyl ester carboxylesterase
MFDPTGQVRQVLDPCAVLRPLPGFADALGLATFDLVGHSMGGAVAGLVELPAQADQGEARACLAAASISSLEKLAESGATTLPAAMSSSIS